MEELNEADLVKWQRSQQELIRWRRENKISDDAAMPSYDQTAKWFGRHVQEGRLLEIGCKTGGLRKSRFFPAGLEYHGLDPLRVDGGDYSFPFQCAMAEEMHFPAGLFDAVLIKDSFDYFPAPGLVLERIREVLVPGGFLFINEADHPTVKRRVLEMVNHGLAITLSPLSSRSWTTRTLLEERGIVVRPKRDFHNTYPNGDYSRRKIIRLLTRAGFSIQGDAIRGERLLLVCRSRVPCLPA